MFFRQRDGTFFSVTGNVSHTDSSKAYCISVSNARRAVLKALSFDRMAHVLTVSVVMKLVLPRVQ